MAVSYDSIREDFERIRGYFTNDLEVLVKQNVSVNYLAAFLIACACETIAWYKYHNSKGDLVFKELLPERWKPVAFSLYDAMRNGIAHRYETKRLKVGERHLDICISWKMERHLTFSPDKTAVYLNIKDMAGKLFALFEQYERDLRVSPDLREKFRAGSRGSWDKSPPGNEIAIWKELLSKS